MSLEGIIFISLYAIFDAWEDVGSYKKGWSIMKKRSWMLRASVGIIITLLIYGFSWLAIPYAFVLSAVFWLIFDPMYNIFRADVPIDYVGLPGDEDDAWLDIIFFKFKRPFLAQLAAKLTYLAITIMAFYITRDAIS